MNALQVRLRFSDAGTGRVVDLVARNAIEDVLLVASWPIGEQQAWQSVELNTNNVPSVVLHSSKNVWYAKAWLLAGAELFREISRQAGVQSVVPSVHA